MANIFEELRRVTTRVIEYGLWGAGLVGAGVVGGGWWGVGGGWWVVGGGC